MLLKKVFQLVKVFLANCILLDHKNTPMTPKFCIYFLHKNIKNTQNFKPILNSLNNWKKCTNTKLCAKNF
jgi:hypothetical protein